MVKEKWIELHPLINPVALDARRREPCHMTLTLQARGLLTDSNLLRVEIAYDGKWSDDTDEMARHTVVKAV